MSCCPECGRRLSLATPGEGEHECDPEERVEYQALRARVELVSIEQELARYLATPRARKLLAFRRFLEDRDRRAA